jgi:hypothetical protein
MTYALERFGQGRMISNSRLALEPARVGIKDGHTPISIAIGHKE